MIMWYELKYFFIKQLIIEYTFLRPRARVESQLEVMSLPLPARLV